MMHVKQQQQLNISNHLPLPNLHKQMNSVQAAMIQLNSFVSGDMKQLHTKPIGDEVDLSLDFRDMQDCRVDSRSFTKSISRQVVN